MITKEFFNKLFPTAGLNPRKFNLVRRRDELIHALNKFLPKYKIDSYLRVCAFLANCGIETDYFRTTEEYASGWDYDISVNPKKARELGNFKKGDGPRFKGSGLSQTTGGFNFASVQKAIGKILGIDVVMNPEILRENIEVAVESACIFWLDNNLNSYADRGLFKELSAIVNRGDKKKTPLHWAKRNELYSLLKRRVPADFSFPKIVSTKPSMTAPTGDSSSALPAGDQQPRLTDIAAGQSNAGPIVLTPTEPATDNSFLNAALDTNLSADTVKAALPSFGTRVWRYVARPLALLYAALEAGSVAAWLGVVVAVVIVVYLIYAHRKDILKLWETLKNKFTQ